MTYRRQILLLALAALAGCRSSAGPSSEAVKKAAESLFDRAARGEAILGIRFTGEGTATPRLLNSEITARRRIAGQGVDTYEYEVRLTYLNRIQQMEWSTVTLRLTKGAKGWQASP